MIENLKMHTPDLVGENFRKLAELFPNAVTETITGYTTDSKGNVLPIIKRAIDADVLRQEISAEVVEGPQERYQFTWPDKKKAMVLANAPIAKTLRLDREKSVGRDGTPGSIDTENIYIEGDNLDALKLLQETYLGKVKMIYIDPPYNTGNDSIYKDNFFQTTGKYLKNSGQFDKAGNQLVPNTESNGRFHTDWLNMMYPRLKIARDLLTEDGILLISTDENEVENLGKICSEVFGRSNFVECLVYDKKAAAKGVPPINMVVGVHEYVYCYAKNYDKFSFIGVKRSMDSFSNPDNDSRGPWRNTNIKSTVSEKQFTIVDPVTGNAFTDTWAYSEEEIQSMIRENRLIFPSSPNGQVRAKEFYSEFQKEYTPLKSSLGLYDAQWNTEMLSKLMKGKFFQNPKHLKLIKFLIQTITNEDSTILDFFSGSATTAHAVMQLNAEDGGKRKFIMVQFPEGTGEDSEARKAGYETICDIGEERIRRAGKKIKEETGADLDYGFRVFRVDESNMEDVYYTPAELKQNQLGFLADNIKSDRTPEDLLFQVMLDLGIPLSSTIQESVIAGKRVFDVAENHLLACFDGHITEETVTTIAKRHPNYAVFRDSSFAFDNVSINFDQIFATYSPNTVRRTL